MSVVYAYINKAGGRCYVGRAKDFSKRHKQHRDSNDFGFLPRDLDKDFIKIPNLYEGDDYSVSIMEYYLIEKLKKNRNTYNTASGHNPHKDPKPKNFNDIWGNLEDEIEKYVFEDIPYATLNPEQINDYTIDDYVNVLKLNFDLPVQRRYLWPSHKQQRLFNTLLNPHRSIPQVFFNKHDDIYDVIDGKQRLITIRKIINNEICLERKNAEGLARTFFKEGTDYVKKIYFSDLPKNIQEYIKSVKISSCVYSDLNNASIKYIFKNLNNGTALSGFSKNIAESPEFRINVTSKIEEYIAPLFSEKELRNSEDENAIFSIMWLRKNGWNGVISTKSADMEDFAYWSEKENIIDKIKEKSSILCKRESCIKKLPPTIKMLLIYYAINDDSKIEHKIDEIFIGQKKIGNYETPNLHNDTCNPRKTDFLKEIYKNIKKEFEC